MNKRTVGNIFESKAIEFLNTNGVTVLEKNYRNKSGEIDIIGKDGNYLVFFEVKGRNSGHYGAAECAVTKVKQRQIINVSKYYLYVKHLPMSTSVRYDVIAINSDKIHWIKNAFLFC